ncbi:aromatic acid exporter family protein [Metabacillus sp. KIGAM252]|uniref:Aromatic acid exporter family protein n=1 Tax=Metabacillus flavus TaxID=2823519 RepID=A0ABS5LBI1_9BACI|nr:aromatic acid exporter family protein [Metabacillus flavus]MBS2967971.1 aromatic acid exporter family protein [Metabacillus flavus]
MKLGARILKTGIAIAIALWIASLLNLQSPVFAGIAAIFAIQPTIYRSYLSVIEQVQANFIGAAFAIVFGLIFGPHPFVVGLTAVIVISINLKLKIQNTIPVAIVTVIAIMETPGENFIQFALLRFGTVMLGVFSAFIVNLLFLPPKYETKLYYRISDSTEEILKWIRINIRQASEHSVLKEDIERLKENMMQLDQLYLLYKEERNYLRRNTLTKSRKLVLFRQMLLTTNKALDTLKKLHRLENELHLTTPELQQIITTELDYLLSYHERILLKFIGKIKTETPNELIQEGFFNKRELVEEFMKYQNQCHDPACFYHMLPLVANILDYSEQLEHLDTLINSFQSYHKEENEIEISETKE